MKKLFVVFITLLSIGITQAQDNLKKYENDKYRFSFSYPGEHLLLKENDEQCLIYNAAETWGITYKIMHLQGKSFDSYVKSLSTSLINTYFNELSAQFGPSEKSPHAKSKYLLDGFEFDLFISGYMPKGGGLENLTKSQNVYLYIFRKTSHADFIRDGIVIYTFGSGLDFDNNKMTDQVINSFVKTVVFKEAVIKKPVIKSNPVAKTTVAQKPLKSIDIKQTQGNLKSVKIGKQTWMAKNLDVATYRNGDPIPQVTNEAEWATLTTGAWCYYNNDSATYAATYGKLYNWYAVNDPRGLAPTGWHVPSDAEWTTIQNFLGGEKLAGGAMKETGITHWQTPNIDATNISSFAGLPGGNRNNDGTFAGVTNFGYWWSSTEEKTTFALYPLLTYNNGSIDRTYNHKQYGFSVRCLID